MNIRTRMEVVEWKKPIHSFPFLSPDIPTFFSHVIVTNHLLTELEMELINMWTRAMEKYKISFKESHVILKLSLFLFSIYQRNIYPNLEALSKEAI